MANPMSPELERKTGRGGVSASEVLQKIVKGKETKEKEEEGIAVAEKKAEKTRQQLQKLKGKEVVFDKKKGPERVDDKIIEREAQKAAERPLSWLESFLEKIGVDASAFFNYENTIVAVDEKETRLYRKDPSKRWTNEETEGLKKGLSERIALDEGEELGLEGIPSKEVVAKFKIDYEKTTGEQWPEEVPVTRKEVFLAYGRDLEESKAHGKKSLGAAEDPYAEHENGENKEEEAAEAGHKSEYAHIPGYYYLSDNIIQAMDEGKVEKVKTIIDEYLREVVVNQGYEFQRELNDISGYLVNPEKFGFLLKKRNPRVDLETIFPSDLRRQYSDYIKYTLENTSIFGSLEKWLTEGQGGLEKLRELGGKLDTEHVQALFVWGGFNKQRNAVHVVHDITESMLRSRLDTRGVVQGHEMDYRILDVDGKPQGFCVFEDQIGKALVDYEAVSGEDLGITKIGSDGKKELTNEGKVMVRLVRSFLTLRESELYAMEETAGGAEKVVLSHGGYGAWAFNPFLRIEELGQYDTNMKKIMESVGLNRRNVLRDLPYGDSGWRKLHVFENIHYEDLNPVSKMFLIRDAIESSTGGGIKEGEYTQSGNRLMREFFNSMGITENDWIIEKGQRKLKPEFKERLHDKMESEWTAMSKYLPFTIYSTIERENRWLEGEKQDKAFVERKQGYVKKVGGEVQWEAFIRKINLREVAAAQKAMKERVFSTNDIEGRLDLNFSTDEIEIIKSMQEDIKGKAEWLTEIFLEKETVLNSFSLVGLSRQENYQSEGAAASFRRIKDLVALGTSGEKLEEIFKQSRVMTKMEDVEKAIGDFYNAQTGGTSESAARKIVGGKIYPFLWEMHGVKAKDWWKKAWPLSIIADPLTRDTRFEKEVIKGRHFFEVLPYQMRQALEKARSYGWIDKGVQEKLHVNARYALTQGFLQYIFFILGYAVYSLKEGVETGQKQTGIN